MVNPSIQLRLALPSKGMEDDTLRFLEAAGLSVSRSNPRQYRARVPALPGVEVLFQRAVDIFAKVQEGSADLGITGYDVVREHEREDDDAIVLYQALGYGACSLVLAVPDSWIDVTTVTDLAEVATDLRAQGRELTVATKYPNLTRQFLYEHGINAFTLIESSGALEVAPVLGYADVVCDLMSSGVTLRENRLKTVGGGTVLSSEACLVANRRALARDADKLRLCRSVLESIEAYQRSRDYLTLTANVQGDSAEAVARQVTAHAEIAGLSGPTIARVYPKAGSDADWFAVTVVVRRDLLERAVEHLRHAGAATITATSLRYVFESKSWSYEALKRQIDEVRDKRHGRDGQQGVVPERGRAPALRTSEPSLRSARAGSQGDSSIPRDQ